ncbi:MAG: hypothetical protein J6K32_12285 [Clostridia bacterium]|nr:hypothetical protein [Clostridia bacterium]
MKKEEIEAFIAIMHEVCEEWTPEEVEAEFGDISLREAVNMRIGAVHAAVDRLGDMAAEMRAEG